ncbi:acyl-CoA dehydrogenase [Microbacteriaceae bacterium VKM Ac-2854]|nr:acyl-CoA dehydrogenase [Microbacteriaceae bacterium VKM Ac-2854]
MSDLETVLGDPTVPGPFDFEAIVAADDARELSDWGERALAAWGWGAEFVPASAGGRWVSTEQLVHRLRPVFRRDPALGLGHGLTSLMAAVNVWAGGDERVRTEVAGRLLAGERIAVGFHELAHGNDLLANDCRATITDEAVRIDGGKQVVNNLDRAEAVLLFARSSEALGPRSHTLVLWRKGAADAGHADTAHRYPTAGMRGCRLGGADFDGLLLDRSAVVGELGGAVGTALRAFQVTRAVVPALAVGGLDTGLRLAVDYAAQRRLYRGRVLDLPHAGALLADAAADLLLCDAFSASVVRALHHAPRSAFLLSAASKYLVPSTLNEAMRTLSVLFGSTFYARVSPYAAFEKLCRDLLVVPIGHAGATTCLLSIIPNLPAWRRRAERAMPPQDELFTPGSVTTEIDFARFEIGAGAGDPFGAELLAATTGSARVDGLIATFAQLRAELLAATAALDPRGLGPDASPATFALARRYTLVQAAGACVGVWRCAAAAAADDADGSDASDADTADPRWLSAALQRLLAQYRGRRAVLDADSVEFLVERTLRRREAGLSLGLDATPVTVATRTPTIPSTERLPG